MSSQSKLSWHDMRAAAKMIPPILQCCPTMSEVDVGGIGNRQWTFPPISPDILLPCDRWKQRGSLRKWCLTRKCLWSKGGSLNFSMQKKIEPIDVHWHWRMFVKTKQWMWAQWGSGWCVSAVATATVSHLGWCRSLWVWHAGCWSSLVKCTANGDHHVEKLYFVAVNLLYQIVSLCTL